MAYINQKQKREKMPFIKAVLKKYGMKATVAIRNHSTLVVTLKEGLLDFTKDEGVNPYWIDHHFTGKKRAFLNELMDAMKGHDWFDKSDSQVDYFHTAFYNDIHIGTWKKPYVCTG